MYYHVILLDLNSQKQLDRIGQQKQSAGLSVVSPHDRSSTPDVPSCCTTELYCIYRCGAAVPSCATTTTVIELWIPSCGASGRPSEWGGGVAKRGGGAETSKDADTMGLGVVGIVGIVGTVGTVGSGYRGYRGIVGVASWDSRSNCFLFPFVSFLQRRDGGRQQPFYHWIGRMIQHTICSYCKMHISTLLLFPSACCLCENTLQQCAHLPVPSINPRCRAIRRRTRASGGLASLDSRGDERGGAGAVHVRPVAAQW